MARKNRKEKEAKLSRPKRLIQESISPHESDVSSISSTSIRSGDSYSDLDSALDGTEDSDAVDIEDGFEAAISLLLDALQTSTKMRVGHLEALTKAMTSHVCTEFFDNQKQTLQGILEKSIKRSPEEEEAAVATFNIFLLTMGTDEDFCDDMFSSFFAQLNCFLLDYTKSPSFRSKCAVALALGSFITGAAMSFQMISQVLQNLLTIVFASGTGLKELHELKCTCLDMYSLLISAKSHSFILDNLHENIVQLEKCLRSPDLSLRVSAGECIALLVEKTELINIDVEEIENITELSHELATDAQKWRSKKDLRQQRSIFRQICSTLEGDSFDEEMVSINTKESIVIESWQSKRYYDTFCSVLGSGMRAHLSQNQFLRDVFGLGPIPLLMASKEEKMVKLEHKYNKNVARKLRQFNRAKVRGKRADYYTDYD